MVIVDRNPALNSPAPHARELRRSDTFVFLQCGNFVQLGVKYLTGQTVRFGSLALPQGERMARAEIGQHLLDLLEVLSAEHRHHRTLHVREGTHPEK